MINVTTQLPEFVSSDYPGFVDFLNAYYEWYETVYSEGYYGDLIDIDTTLESFLQYFRKELDIFGITNDSTSRFYLKRLKELYTAKGSNLAAKFLFSILFNKASTISLPWLQTAIVSGAKWRVPISITLSRVDEEGPLGITLEQAKNVVGKEITVVDTDGNSHSTIVENVTVLPNRDFELYIRKLGFGRKSLEASEIYLPEKDYFTIARSTVTGVTVLSGGEGFSVGQIFEIPYDGKKEMKIRIASVGSIGQIEAVEILTFPYSYTADFNFVIDDTTYPEIVFYPQFHVIPATDLIFLGGTSDNTLVTVDSDILTGDVGTITHDFQTGDEVIYRKGSSANEAIPPLEDGVVYYAIRISSTKLKLAATYADSINGVAIDLQSGATGVEHTLSRVGEAILRFETGTVRHYPGYYDDLPGMHIHDSHKYQIYSYVTSIEETLDKYKTILRNVIHPAGTKHFADYTVSMDANISTADIDIEIDTQGLD